MKILQICNKPPFPPKDGGSIAMNNITVGLLSENCDVKVLAITTPKHFANVSDLPIDYVSKTSIEFVFIDTSINAFDAFLSMINNKSYNLSRFYSKKFEQKIIETLKRNTFDIIQLESLFVSMYINTIRKYSKAKIILRTHNIENIIWDRKSKLEKNIFRKIYISILSSQIKKEEITAINSSDAIAAITEEDKKWVLRNCKQKNIKTIPFGIDVKDYDIDNTEMERKSIFFIGSFDWFPNADGLNWFLKNVWVKMLDENINLYIAGRGMSEEFKNTNLKNVHILGEIDNVKQFMTSKNVMIVPLLSGGGMRVKIIEGMAMGKVVISTSIGAEGIEYTNNKNIIIANTPDEFINSIKLVFQDEALNNSLSINAREFVSTNYDNSKICKELIQFYKSIN